MKPELSEEVKIKISEDAKEYALGMMGYPDLTKLDDFGDKQMCIQLQKAYYQGSFIRATRAKVLVEALADADDTLTYLEGFLHGKDSKQITESRCKIANALNEYNGKA